MCRNLSISSHLRPNILWEHIQLALSAKDIYSPDNLPVDRSHHVVRQIILSPKSNPPRPAITVAEYDRCISNLAATTGNANPKKKPQKGRVFDDGVRGHSFGKKRKIAEVDETVKNNEVIRTMSIGLKPNKHQKKMLNFQIKVANHAYNWCLWLVTNDKCVTICEKTGTVYPNSVALNKIVSCNNLSKIPDDSRPFLVGPGQKPLRRRDIDSYLFRDDDSWFFSHGMASSQVKVCQVCAVKTFVQSYAVHAKGVERNYRGLDTKFGGSFGVQRAYIRRHNFDDKKLSILPDLLNQRHGKSKVIDKGIPVARSTSTLPWQPWWMKTRKEDNTETTDDGEPLEKKAETMLTEKIGGPYLPRDCQIVKLKKRSGKFVLRVPCNANFFRKPLDQSELSRNRITSIDPGIRSFATAFDAKSTQCWQVGTVEEMNALTNV